MSFSYNSYLNYLIPIGVLGLLLFPYIWQGEQVFIPVSDNLDSNLAWWKAMKDQGKIFSSWDEPVYGMMIESERFTYPSPFNVEGLLYFIFPVFLAYLINKCLIFIFAFVGFRLWLKQQSNLAVSARLLSLIPLLWATLSFYPHRGISIAFLPLIVLVFDYLFSGKVSWKYFLVIVFYAFYSKLVLAGFYFLLGFVLWGIWIFIKEKKFPIYGFLGVLTLGIAWGIQEIYLIKGLFFNDSFQSHREDFTYDFGIWADLMPWDFFWSGNQSGVHFAPFYFLLALFFLIFLQNKIEFKIKIIRDLGFVLGISLILALISHLNILTVFGEVIPSLASLNFLRFEFWIPYFLFSAFVRSWAAFNFKGEKVIIPVLLMINIFVYQYEWRYLINQKLNLIDQKVPSYQSYYSEENFQEIKRFLGDDWKQIPLVHINIPPAVSSYNGFLSLDGYLQNYQRSHKMDIYRVIAGELEKDESLRKHFMNWGNKCYFQNAEYPDDYFMYSWRRETPIRELDFDFEFLKESLQGQIILSALPINSNQLVLNRVFEHSKSAWRIYLYSIDRSD